MDRLSKTARSANMRAIKSKGMKPEMAVRRLVHGLGYRYRLHSHKMPGRPDMIFAGRQAVIFVHGCFWHQHKGCRITGAPKSNTSYWGPKLARNVERDARNIAALEADGWRVLVIWECETKDGAKLASRLKRFLGRRTSN